MNPNLVLDWLESWHFSQVMRESWWAFPTVESIHVVAITLVVGSIMIVDLRLLDLASVNKPVGRFAKEILPWTWGCFVCAATSGALMFAAKAHAYVADAPFRFKMLFLLAGGLNMAVFHMTSFKRVHLWDHPGPTPVAAKLAGAISLAIWITIVALGRWIGFTVFG